MGDQFDTLSAFTGGNRVVGVDGGAGASFDREDDGHGLLKPPAEIDYPGDPTPPEDEPCASLRQSKESLERTIEAEKFIAESDDDAISGEYKRTARRRIKELKDLLAEVKAELNASGC